MSIKTLTFWLDGVTNEQDAMLREILRRLGDAQREATKAWLKLACEGNKCDAAMLQVGRAVGREAFAKSPFSTQLWNGYSYDEAFVRFKTEWRKIARGEKSAVPFPGDAPFIWLVFPWGQFRVEGSGETWGLRGVNLHGSHSPERFDWAIVSRAKKTPGRRAKMRGAFRDYENLAQAKKIAAARIMRSKDGRGWVAQVIIHLEDAPAAIDVLKRERWAGIDVGMNNPAVLSIPDAGFAQFYGREEYRELWQRLDRYEARKAELNRAKKYREARDLKVKITGIRQHINELITRQIVRTCMGMKCTGVRIEDLKGIQATATGKLKHWPRFHLVQRLEQKCAEVGLACEKVKPAGTSQTCSWCGHREPGNRMQSQFRCLKCGYTRHADLNAANNIARDLRAFGPCGHSASADELRFDGVGLQQALDLPTGSARSLRSARQEPPHLAI